MNWKNFVKNYFLIMKLIRAFLLTVAIYSGAFATNSDGVNIVAAIICGLTCSAFVSIEDDNKD